MKLPTLIATSVAGLALTPALAHHSRANFDLDRTLEIEGTVTGNPDRDHDLNAGYELQEYLCDSASSRRHLTAGEE